MATPHLDLRMSQWLNKLDIGGNGSDMLEPLLHEALTIACKQIKENLRRDHPTWKNRTYALYKAIDSMFTKKLQAVVFIDEETLRYYSNNGPYILNPNYSYREGEYVGAGKRFPNKPFRNYANYLMEGTQARFPVRTKAFRFVDSTGHIRFRKHVRGHEGDSTWLARARRKVNYRKIIGEVLDRHGIKHD